MLPIAVHGDHSTCSKPPADFKTEVPFWPCQALPGQSGTFVLKSTGGFEQVEWSPCSMIMVVELAEHIFQNKICEINESLLHTR